MSKRKAKHDKHTKAPANAKCDITLHTMPSFGTPAENAMLLMLLARAWEFGQKMPGIAYPLHVAIDVGEGENRKRLCGSVEPSSLATTDSSGVRFANTCN